MKNLIVVFLFMATAIFASAQNKSTQLSQGLSAKNTSIKSSNLNAEEKANKLTEKLVTPLKLTDKQKADINSINVKSIKEAEKIEVEIEELRMKKKKIVEDTTSKIRQVLSEEQSKKLDLLLKNKEDKQQAKPASTNKK
jgi:hypothetical protein